MKHDERLKEYAKLAVLAGVALQKDQDLVVRAPLEAQPLAEEIVRLAYAQGARYVHMEWSDEGITRARFEHASDQALQYFPKWIANGYEEMAQAGAAFLTIYAPNPDLLSDLPPTRVAMGTKTVSEVMKGYRAYLMSDRARWSLISYPTSSWAKKVFPELDIEEAKKRLWEVILRTARAATGDPLENWRKHRRNLERRVDILNAKRYRALYYRAPGTDLKVGLPEGHLWHGGGSIDARGIPFLPNIPTEEVYTMPHRERVEGTVRATKPLVYNGSLIDGFTLTFENGRVVSARAERGEDVLHQLLDMDEGARYLGEVALVPVDSPIYAEQILFYNTLFDENASCHLALGEAYPTTLEGGVDLSKEALRAKGANTSLVHEDFMIGSPELSIDGERPDGTLEPVFRQGKWAFEV
ncbi:MAG: aminopeptidase [Candidatus Carbobacillus sp.]|nr:aminopeptidase [Candidatus Carbobacillus sp.]